MHWKHLKVEVWKFPLYSVRWDIPDNMAGLFTNTKRRSDQLFMLHIIIELKVNVLVCM